MYRISFRAESRSDRRIPQRGPSMEGRIGALRLICVVGVSGSRDPSLPARPPGGYHGAVCVSKDHPRSALALVEVGMRTRWMSRRGFLQSAGAAGLAGIAHAASATTGDRSGRKMTMDLVCGNLGVKADLPTAITLAHANGF